MAFAIRRFSSFWSPAIVVLAMMITSASLLRAQKEYDRWYFGDNAGVDFLSGNAVGRDDGMLKTEEGSASICDRRTGDLLFYTDGITVWNRSHRVMLGGTGLAGHTSSAQSAVIVPVPCSPSRYYIFTTDAEPYVDPPNEGMHYSLVDMDRDGGMGEVVTRNVELLPSASERLIAIRHANRRDYWVIAHSLGGNTFHAFLVTAAGVGSVPVNSTVGIDQGDPIAAQIWTMGFLKGSPDGARIAQTTLFRDLLELFDFDASSGVVSNAFQLPVPAEHPWGISFSPDNSRLYVTLDERDELIQYTLAPYDPSSIIASRTRIADVASGADLQIGPDGRIYASGWKRGALGVIMQPNLGGTACGYVPDAVDLRLRNSVWCLPNIITGGLQVFDECDLDASIDITDPLLCPGECARVVDRSAGNPRQWQWSFPGGSPASFTGQTPPRICYPAPGRYTVTLVVHGEWSADTASAVLTVVDAPVLDAGPDIHLCEDSSATISTSLHPGDSLPLYAWSPAAGLSCTDCPSPVARPAVSTTYRVTVTTSAGCSAVDSVRVVVGRATARAAVGRGHRGEPGDTLFLPVMLIDPLDIDRVTEMTLTLRCDSSVVRMLPTPTRTDSTLMGGWTITTVEQGDGFLRLHCQAPAGEILHGTGALVRVPVRLFLGRVDSSEIGLEVALDDRVCTDMSSAPGLVRVVGCMVDTRLIELFDAKYALSAPEPSPFRDMVEISFSTALPGHVRLDLSDNTGRHVATLVDGEMAEGWHRVVWNAERVAAGRYYLTLAAGEWRETVSVVKVE
jgi:PKD repeat protein